MARRSLYVCAALLCLTMVYQVGAKNAEGKVPPSLLGMTDYPRASGSAVAIDQAGAIYFGQTGHWRRVATTPGPPANIWSRSSTGEVFIVLANGDLYRLEADWTLTPDSNVFTSL